jgi:hypothetical protein
MNYAHHIGPPKKEKHKKPLHSSNKKVKRKKANSGFFFESIRF